LEVADGAQPTDDDLRPDPARAVHEQPREVDGRCAGDATDRGLDHLHALLGREQRRFGGVLRDGDHYLIEQRARAARQIQVAVRERIEAAREQRDACLPHDCPPSAGDVAPPAVYTCTRVSPYRRSRRWPRTPAASGIPPVACPANTRRPP